MNILDIFLFRINKILFVFFVAISMNLIPHIYAEPFIEDPLLEIELVATGLSSPTSMAFVDTNNILVLEKNSGEIRMISHGQLVEDPILKLNIDYTTPTCCRGLLGIAVDNHNSTISEVYLYFSTASTVDEPVRNKVYKYQWDGNNLQNPQLLLDLPATPGPNHPGGKIITGKDGHLYTAIGDLNNEGILQNILSNEDITDSSVILRINSTDGSAPSDNPFIKMKESFPGSNIEKYYGYGIRNTFGLTIDPITGYLWETENGDRDYDEINIIFPGFNSGWKQLMGPISESDVKKNDLVTLPGSYYGDPVFSWEPSLGVTDLEFFDSKKLGDKYENNLFVGDINDGNIYFFEMNNTRTGLDFSNPDIHQDLVSNEEEKDSITWGRGFEGITDLETGPDGYLYVLTFDQERDGEGEIYRIFHSEDFKFK